jgi:hypothetical protein
MVNRSGPTPDPLTDNSPHPRRWIPPLLWAFAAILLLLVVGTVLRIEESPTFTRASEQHFGLDRLPRFQDRGFRSEPYIRAAVALQAMGRDQACEQIIALAKRDRDAEEVFVLCRMLFVSRRKSEFRRPMIGGAVFLADTSYADWPLEPVELVDGVPFIITWGYDLAGHPEAPESYLEYCMANCDWSTLRYRERNRSELHAALAKLLGSSKWRRPLKQQEREHLMEQIE